MCRRTRPDWRTIWEERFDLDPWELEEEEEGLGDDTEDEAWCGG